MFRNLITKLIFCTTSLWVAANWHSEVHAQQSALGMAISYPQKITDLLDQRIYRISFKCTALSNLVGSRNASLFINRNVTTGHVIVIADALPTGDAAGKSKFPESARSLYPVFFALNGRADPDNRTACPNDLLVYGGRKLYLIESATYSTSHEPGFFLSLGYGLAGLIPPLWSAFQGKMDVDVAKRFTDVQQTEDPLKKTLKAFNEAENYTVTKELGPGDYIVTTPFSKVVVSVKYIQSVLKDGGPRMRKPFRDQLDGAKEALVEANLATTCRTAAAGFLASGFSRQEDVPFALAYRAIRSGLAKDSIIDCLGRDTATQAAALQDFWPRFATDDQIITPQYVKDRFPVSSAALPEQAPYSSNKPLTERLTRALAIATSSETLASNSLQRFSRIVKAPFSFVDETKGEQFGGTSNDLSAEVFLNTLISKGFRRFGCHQATEFGLFEDGGKTLLMAFKADQDNETLPIHDVAILKPIYSDGLVSKLIAYNDYDWVNSVMSGRKYVCADTIVEKPPSEVARIIQ